MRVLLALWAGGATYANADGGDDFVEELGRVDLLRWGGVRATGLVAAQRSGTAALGPEPHNCALWRVRPPAHRHFLSRILAVLDEAVADQRGKHQQKALPLLRIQAQLCSRVDSHCWPFKISQRVLVAVGGNGVNNLRQSHVTPPPPSPTPSPHSQL